MEQETQVQTETPKAEPQRFQGKVVHISSEGWGFITTPEIKFVRIFFHWTALEQDTLNFKDLKKGMKVEFQTKEFEGKGVRAIKIRVLNDRVSKSGGSDK